MTQSPDGLHRFGLKLLVEPDTVFDCRQAIPVFHRWIQTAALDELLLIDVADYTHLVDGPSVLLVGHEVNLSLDTAEDQLGLLCMRKRPGSGSLVERLQELTRILLTAGHLLESEPTLEGRLRFIGSTLQFVSNDRLIAPPGEPSAAALAAPLCALGSILYADEAYSLACSPATGDRLRMTLSANAQTSLETLIQRVS